MNLLRYKREKLDISLQQIANEIGVSRMTVSDWERDKKLPTIDKLTAIQKIYELTDEELLSFIKRTSSLKESSDK